MCASAVYILAFAGFAFSITIPDKPADTAIPMEGEFDAAVEEATRKQRSGSKGPNGIVRTIHHFGTLQDGSSKGSKGLSIGSTDMAEDAELENLSTSASCKWMIAVVPPLLLLGFVIFIRNAAEKAKQKDSKETWFNSFLRTNLIQQALAVAGQENETSKGIEDNAEMGRSLLSKTEDDYERGCCPDSEATAGAPLLQPVQEEDEDEIDESAKLFASLAESLYQDSMEDDDDVQVLAADADVTSKIDPADPVNEPEWNMFQGAAGDKGR